VWIEQPGTVTVSWLLYPPGPTSGVAAKTLLAAMEKPLAGPPRRPARIRVDDASLVPELGAAIGDSIPVVVTASPELDAVRDWLKDRAVEAAAGTSYLAGGRVAHGTVLGLFEAACILFKTRPWEAIWSDCGLRVDIPAQGVVGACAGMVDEYHEGPGFIIFPSHDGFAVFSDFAEER